MTISEIQLMLIKLWEKYRDIEVYFNCPKCNNTFTPNKVVIAAVHLANKEDEISINTSEYAMICLSCNHRWKSIRRFPISHCPICHSEHIKKQE